MRFFYFQGVVPLFLFNILTNIHVSVYDAYLVYAYVYVPFPHVHDSDYE